MIGTPEGSKRANSYVEYPKIRKGPVVPKKEFEKSKHKYYMVHSALCVHLT